MQQRTAAAGRTASRRGRVPATQADTGEPRQASVIRNVMNVLRCFTVAQPLQGVTEIADQVGLHKSTVSRILATLEQESVVERDPETRKFRLGLGLISVAGPLLANLDVRRISLPMLRELSADTGETIALAVWSGSESVTVEQVDSPQQVKHTNPLGTRYGTVLSASVQVFLSELDPGEVEDLIRRGVPTIPADGTLDELHTTLKEVRERGFALNLARTSPQEVGIAAPVRDHRGEVVAAVLLAAPAYRVAEDLVPRLGAAVVSTAQRISARLGAP